MERPPLPDGWTQDDAIAWSQRAAKIEDKVRDDVAVIRLQALMSCPPPEEVVAAAAAAAARGSMMGARSIGVFVPTDGLVAWCAAAGIVADLDDIVRSDKECKTCVFGPESRGYAPPCDGCRGATLSAWLPIGSKP